MKRPQSQLRYRSRGGIIPVRNLRTVAECAMSNGVESMRMETRQDIVVPHINAHSLKHFPGLSDFVEIETNSKSQSQYTITTTSPAGYHSKRITWLNDSAYQEVLDLFSTPPSIRVALSDPTQHILPIYAGDVIFLATEIRGYWHIALQNNLEPLYFSREAVPSELIPEIVHFLELRLSAVDTTKLEDIYSSLRLQFKDEIIPVETSLPHTYDEHLDFLGFRSGTTSDQYCLGIHCPSGKYKPSFIQEICVLARKQGIKKLAITPSGTLLASGIQVTKTRSWRKLLGRYSVPLNHEGYSPYTLNSSNPISKQIVETLGYCSTPADGITFAIDSDPRDGEAIIRITCNRSANKLYRFFHNRYTLEYCENFIPHLSKRITISSTLSFSQLITELCALINAYYRHEAIQLPDRESPKTKSTTSSYTYSCSDCYTQYTPHYGDPRAGITPNRTFASLPETWNCSVCEAPKKNFKLVKTI